MKNRSRLRKSVNRVFLRRAIILLLAIRITEDQTTVPCKKGENRTECENINRVIAGQRGSNIRI